MSASESTGFAAPTDESVAGLVESHAVDLEQCALFVDSEPLKRSMTDAAAFLRGPLATALSTLAAERGGKVFCAMLSTGVCDQIARAEASEARATALEAERDGLKALVAEYCDHSQPYWESRAATAEAQLARAREALEGMLRLSDMGYEASLNEPEENGNFAAYEFARKMLETLRSTAPADGRGEQMGASASYHQEPPVRRVRHRKRGTTYEVLGEAQVQTSRPLTDYEVVTIYRSLDGDIDNDAAPMKGDLWVRPKAEFNDGRFEEITAPPVGSGRTLADATPTPDLPSEARADGVKDLRETVARIVDPHSFVPFSGDDQGGVFSQMVEDSKGDALRKADRILATVKERGHG